MSNDQPSLFGMENLPARHTDPDTSHEAVVETGELRERQEAVLACLRLLGPVADVDWIPQYKIICHHHGWPWQGDSGLRTRRSELVAKGRVRKVAKKEIRNRRHWTWEVVP